MYAHLLSQPALALLFSLVSVTLNFASTADPKTVHIEPEIAISRDAHQALVRRVLKQIDAISITLQELAQSVHEDKIKVKNKLTIINHIVSLQTFIANIKNQKHFSFNDQGLASLLEINKFLIAHLHEVLNTNLQEPIPFDIPAILRRSEKVTPIDYGKLLTTINETDRALKKLIQKNRDFNLSLVNRCTRAIEKLAQDSGIVTLSKRILPYGILGLYMIYLTQKDELPECLKPLKKIVGGNPDRIDLQLPFDEKSLSESEKSGLDNGKNARVVQRYPKFAPVHGVLGTPLYHLRQIVDIDTRGILAFSLGSYFKPIITKDAQDLYKYAQETGKKIYAKLKGEPYESPDLVKASKIAFADIPGYDSSKQQLESVIHYFQQKDIFDRTGTHIDRGLLFAGPLDIGKLLVYGLAGEITRTLRARGSETICGVHEIHASLLVTKKIDDIIKDLEEEVDLESPLILHIDNLNWLCEHATADAHLWSNLINVMNKNLSGVKKQIIIIATVSEIKSVDAALKGQNKFGSALQFSNPSSQERVACFAKELSQRGIRPEDCDLEKCALYTENCSYSTIQAIIKSACTTARLRDENTSQEHLEQSIDIIAHNIRPEHHYRSPEQHNTIAVHVAGQVFMHMHKQPRHKQLIKATVYPVGDSPKASKHGALITHALDHAADFITAADLKTDCTILLAGIEAQKQLNRDGLPLVNLVHETRAQAFNLAKAVILQGDQEQNLTKDLKQQKLAQARDLVESCAQEAAGIIKNNIAHVKALADALAAKKIITEPEISCIMGKKN